MAINKFQRSRLTFNFSANVAHIGVPSAHDNLVSSETASTLLSNATVGALIRNVGPSESMIRLGFNMAAASHTWFRNEEF